MRRLAVLLAGCSSTTTTTTTPIVGHETSLSRRALPDYPSVLEPATIDCALEGPWEVAQPRELRLGDGGPVFATVFRPDRARLELAGAVAFVELSVQGFRLWGHVDRTAVVLHPSRAFVFAGYLLPGARATLHPITARANAVTLEAVLPSFVKARSVPRDTHPCKDLGLALANFDPSTALGTELASDGFKLPASTPIPLAATPGATPVAELTFDEEATVSVIERRGEHSRILVDEYYDQAAGMKVVGWVAHASLVHVGAVGHPGNWSTGAGPPHTSGLSRAKRHIRCTHDVPLLIDLGMARHLAGVIQSGTKFGIVDGPEDTLSITFDRIALQLAPDARPMVKQTSLRDCTDVPR